jgi:hypothetical protein
MTTSSSSFVRDGEEKGKNKEEKIDQSSNIFLVQI